MVNPVPELRNAIEKVAARLVRVYNKPDSAITRIAKRAKRRDKLFLQIWYVIAALIHFELIS